MYEPSLSQSGDPSTTRKINVIWNLLSILESSDEIESMRMVNLETIEY